MPTLTVDGKLITVEPGTRVIEAARRLGIEVPRYCYHPGLSIAGNCRICMVEIEKFPKTQIACNTECQEGMVVRTDTEKVKETRRHILEFILINHPLDCPVCDQAGECWLQDYYMKYGLYDARFYEQKVKKPKAVPIGPTVMLDAERCILCSRCVRFCDEISRTSELGIINRGDHAEITVYPGKELDNQYSGCVVDVCPVGALTDRDFRFKCRVWYLKKTDSICPGCSRGCNIEVHTNPDRPQHGGGGRVMRLKPRENLEVNRWWMCDAGRYGYKFIDENRILKPLIPPRREAEWKEALDEVARCLKEAKKSYTLLVSPQLSNEELYLIQKLFIEAQTFLLSPHPEGDQDDLLIRSDKNPNTRGAEWMGFGSLASPQDFFRECQRGPMGGLIIFGQDLLTTGAGLNPPLDLNLFRWSIFIGSNQNLTSESSTYVLPSATYAEKNGTFTNFEGRVQKFNKALEPLGKAQSEAWIFQELGRRLGVPMSYADESEIFKALSHEIPSFQGLTYEKVGALGCQVNGK